MSRAQGMRADNRQEETPAEARLTASVLERTHACDTRVKIHHESIAGVSIKDIVYSILNSCQSTRCLDLVWRIYCCFEFKWLITSSLPVTLSKCFFVKGNEITTVHIAHKLWCTKIVQLFRIQQTEHHKNEYTFFFREKNWFLHNFLVWCHIVWRWIVIFQTLSFWLWL